MRKPMMAGNWKMNKTIDEAVALAKAIRAAVNDVNNVDRVVCPPFVDLPAVPRPWRAATSRSAPRTCTGPPTAPTPAR